jgi:hypothetical protein
MRRKLRFALFVVVCLLVGTGCDQKTHTPVSKETSAGDFILRVKVENDDNNKTVVLRELIYTGNEPVQITHGIPLVSLQQGDKTNPEFAISAVEINKTLTQDESYSYDPPEQLQGTQKKLHALAVFRVNGEDKSIGLEIDIR